jgi:hypothetical protein
MSETMTRDAARLEWALNHRAHFTGSACCADWPEGVEDFTLEWDRCGHDVKTLTVRGHRDTMPGALIDRAMAGEHNPD